MPNWRGTVRWTSDRQRYHMEDVEAPDLVSAMERLRAAIPAEVAVGADLLELRRQAAADEREFSAE